MEGAREDTLVFEPESSPQNEILNGDCDNEKLDLNGNDKTKNYFLFKILKICLKVKSL